MSDVSIHRYDLAELGVGYERISNDAARSLSPFALGLLVEALAHRPDWKHASADEMWRRDVRVRGKDAAGRRQYRAGYAELERAGFRHRLRRSQSGKHFTDVPLVQPADPAVP